MNIIYHGKELSGGGGAAIPTGLISIWYGAVASIPDGWALCDGTNGTPDLRDRFVLGAGGSRAVGATGGEETHKLTTAEMPSHSHSDYKYRGQNATGLTEVTLVAKTIYTSLIYVLNDTKGYRGLGYTNSSGSGSAHNNMPPYYALCYIMKL